MGQPGPLAGVFDGLAPDSGIAELLHELPVKLVADIFDRALVPDDQRFFEIRIFTNGFHVHPHEPETVVDRILEFLGVITGCRRDHDRGTAEPFGYVVLDLEIPFLVHEVYLVDGNECRDVHPVALHGIDEIVLRRIPAYQDVGVHHLRFGEDRTHFLDLQVQRADRVETDTAMRGFLDGDIRFPDIDPDTGVVEFLDEDIEMPFVEDVYKDNDYIGTADNRDHFLAPALAHGCTGNKSWDIEELDLGSLVLEGTGNYGKGGERVRGNSACGAGQLVEERALTG